MKKSIKITITIITLLILFYATFFYSFNQVINSFQPVDKSCTQDEDCKIGRTDCPLCNLYSEGDAVNKNYEPNCPLPPLYHINCTNQKPPWMTDLKPICKNNKCQKKANIHLNLVKHNLEYWSYIILTYS